MKWPNTLMNTFFKKKKPQKKIPPFIVHFHVSACKLRLRYVYGTVHIFHIVVQIFLVDHFSKWPPASASYYTHSTHNTQHGYIVKVSSIVFNCIISLFPSDFWPYHVWHSWNIVYALGNRPSIDEMNFGRFGL